MERPERRGIPGRSGRSITVAVPGGPSFLMYPKRMVRGKRAAWTVVWGLLGASWMSAQPASDARNLCGQVPDIARSLTEISGMKLHHPVPCAFITKEKINEFLKKRVHDSEHPEDIRAEEMVLKKFGFVPPDFNLADSTVDLLTEQAAAFYDYNRKKLFITETTPSESQDTVLAHELAHALADQSFHLARYIRQGRKSDDGSTARLAVMEGQATWLMSEYLARRAGRSLRDSPEAVALMSPADEAGGRAVSGIRECAALPAPDPGFPLHQGHAVPGRGAAARRPGRVCRGLPARARFPRSRFCTPRSTSPRSSPPIRNFPSRACRRGTKA